MEFKKARLRTPKTREQFEPLKIACDEGGWTIIGSGTKARGNANTRPESRIGLLRIEFEAAYHRLANNVESSPGLDGKPVRKVKVDDLRDDLKASGKLDCEDGKIKHADVTRFNDVRKELTTTRPGQKFVQKNDLIWAIYPERPFTFKSRI